MSTTPTTADRWPQRIFCIGFGDGSWGLRFHWFGPQSGWTLVLGPFWLSRLGWNGLSFDRELTVAELYTACRNDVLAEHPSWGQVEMQPEGNTKEQEIERNRKAFVKQLPAIVHEHAGEYALLHREAIVGFFSDALAAQEAGSERYVDSEFSIQLVTQEPAGLGYLSYALFSRIA